MVYKLPKTVQVGPFMYKLIRNRETDQAQAWGKTNHVKREMQFGEWCVGRELAATLIHELLHAVESAYGVEVGEDKIKGVSHGLAQALMDLGLLPEEMEVGD